MAKYAGIVLFLASLVPLSLTACGSTALPTSSSSTVDTIHVRPNEAVKQDGGTEEFPLPNCGGTSDLLQSLGTQATVTRATTIGAKATTSAGAEVAVPEVVKLKLEVAVEAEYQQTYEQANSRLDTIQMKTEPGTHVVYVIQWEERNYVSTASYSLLDTVYSVPYTYTLKVPKLLDSYPVGCPTPTSVAQLPTLIPTAVITPTSIATPIPSSMKTRERDGMVAIHVEAGSFWMGSTDKEMQENIDTCAAGGATKEYCAGLFGDEGPLHSVFLDSFWIDRTEVTNSQYRKCVEDTGACTKPGCWGSGGFDADDAPVVCVSWEQARVYCEWAGARLPTEAEWEKAARGTDQRIYPWGSGAPDCSRANYAGCIGATVAVGSYTAGASPYGVLDMAGNVWEWVGDRYDAHYYTRSPDRNPQGPDVGDLRVVRSGPWHLGPEVVRSANRFGFTPSMAINKGGFRCAMTE